MASTDFDDDEVDDDDDDDEELTDGKYVYFAVTNGFS